ncbi:AAA family ATPase [Amycolatopsis sp.]|uniref:AAA family ATPase n=1 Tax=Amycolatopsis sp. TaxID=37632 RepID=UPI002D80C306|nr:AAA family ATPase [Amycolatopsis sp.]HET6707844.1 AAA family ATPase [Amycolatopsis sp.]
MAGQGFRDELTQLLQARYPLLVVETHEEQRVLREIRAVAEDAHRLRTPRRVYVWSSTTGLAPAGGPPITETRSAAAALERVYGWGEPAVFVFADLHPSLVAEGGHRPDPDVVRRLRELAAAFKTRPVPLSLILVSPSLPVPTELEHDAAVVDFPLPDQRQIGELLDSMVAAHRQNVRVTIDRDDRDTIVAAARGLTLPEAENAFARALVEGGGLDPSDLDLILAEKRQAVRRSGMLDIVPAETGFDAVGGLDRLKRWLTKRTGTWTPAAAAYNLAAPKGLLLTGVPGCGKSLSAVCVANMWRLPLLRLDLGRVFGGLVGSSEKNIRTVIRTAEGIAPCVLWVDEIEKGLAGAGGGGGDGGTARRVFGTFLSWMQEKTAPVFVMATANQVGSLPPEFLRKGRFDEIFFVDLPSVPERIAIWRIHLGKRVTDPFVGSELRLDDALFAELADVSAGYSGAEIEQAVLSGLVDAFAEKRPLRRDDLVRAVRSTVPLSVTQADEILAIRNWAETRAVAATDTGTSEPVAPPPASPASPSGRTIDV